MVVDDLAEPREAGHRDGALAVRERGQDRADARVADDDPCVAHRLGELVERQILDAARVRRQRATHAALNDELFVGRQAVERTQQPVERIVQRAERDEDHEGSRTLPR